MGNQTERSPSFGVDIVAAPVMNKNYNYVSHRRHPGERKRKKVVNQSRMEGPRDGVSSFRGSHRSPLSDASPSYDSARRVPFAGHEIRRLICTNNYKFSFMRFNPFVGT